MLAEISAGYTSLKAAVGIVQGLNATHTQIQINEVKIELQRLMLDAQSALMGAQTTEATASKRISDLEQEIVSFKNWATQKERYFLTEISRGVFTYVLKQTVDGTEPVHCICASCYQHERLSILQSDGGGLGIATLTCSACKAVIKASDNSPNFPFERAPGIQF